VSVLQVSAAPPASTTSVPPPRGFRVQGTAPSNLPILITLALPLRNVGALDSLVTQVSDPQSPMYRHFLSPAQARNEFLPVAAYNSLLSSLQSAGFQVVLTALDSEIVVSGTVAQFQSAFGGGVDTYTNGTTAYYSSTGVTTFDGAYLYASNGTFVFAKPAALVAPRTDSNVTFTSDTFPIVQLSTVYNATSLYSQGFTGAGETIGLLDYYGSPTLGSDLSLFDKTFGIPDTTVNIIPVGPYDPDLGPSVGWSTEVSLDVEASHAMAPGASLDVYVANGALPLSVPLAKIVQDDNVTTLSQSFGYPEWLYSQTSYEGGPTFYGVYALIPDQYYALGSVEGISFTASTGDAGGSGYSSGPEGNSQYPSSSPFVTAVGGTQTYFSENATGARTFVQTAWSNVGYVPNLTNEGGGGGGVSILEPKPWYQSGQSDPPSFPNGRLTPDLSLQAGINPASLIVDAGQVTGIGGTSESSPLLAGLLTLVAESEGGALGLINPLIYGVGNNATEYQKAFDPITFGYTIPWKASYGFNLATGWGAPNVGELAQILNSTAPGTELDIAGEIFNGTGGGQADYTPGQSLTVATKITDGRTTVVSGKFTVELQTLAGTFSPTPMVYNPTTGNWSGTIVMGDESGSTYVFVSGSSGGKTGQAIGVVFSGYLGSISVTGSAYSLPADPWSWNSNSTLSITVFTTDIKGNPAPSGTVVLDVDPYSILSNRYTLNDSVSLNDAGSGAADGYLAKPAPDGPLSLVTEGDVYAYAPTVYGIYLQSSYIYPDVAAEPGSVAPGQYLTVLANPIAPVNVYFETSLETGREFAYDVFVGANVTASLVAPSGSTVSTAQLFYGSCAQALRVCSDEPDVIYGQLQVPFGATSGLYTVMLNASYTSLTPGGNITGSFYGQVWVSNALSVPSITIQPGIATLGITPTQPTAEPPGTPPASMSLYEGEQAQVDARITGSDGSAVTQGEYTAVIYPESLQGQYTSLMHTAYAAGELVPLVYDPASGDWIGNVTLPGASSQGSASGLGITTFSNSGPWDVYVTGVSSDGVPTSSDLGAQQPFLIQPYQYASGTLSSLSSGSGLAFSGATIAASGQLTGDIFAGVNTVSEANVTISDSQILGVLNLDSANVTMVGVSGDSINATNSTVVLRDSNIGNLTLSSSKVSLADSSYTTVDPIVPSLQLSGLSKPISAVASFNVTVTGADLTASSLVASVDGSSITLKVNTTSSGLSAAGTVDPTKLSDGVHSLTLTASQSDGLSSTFTASFSTNAHQQALDNEESNLLYLAIALAVVAVVALVVGTVALRRTNPRVPPATAAPPQV